MSFSAMAPKKTTKAKGKSKAAAKLKEYRDSFNTRGGGRTAAAARSDAQTDVRPGGRSRGRGNVRRDVRPYVFKSFPYVSKVFPFVFKIRMY